MARKPLPCPAPVDPDAAMIPEGSSQGGPSVRFCKVRGANYHLNLNRERVYHDVPAGFAFDDAGVLMPVITENING